MNVSACLVLRSVSEVICERISLAEVPWSRAEQTFLATLMTCCGFSTEIPAWSMALMNWLSTEPAAAGPADQRRALPESQRILGELSAASGGALTPSALL